MDSKRVANQTLFRQVNERINELNDSFSDADQSPLFLCECSDLSCVAPIAIRLDTYRRVRMNPGWFIVAPGHVERRLATVVEKHDDYVIVPLFRLLLPCEPVAEPA